MNPGLWMAAGGGLLALGVALWFGCAGLWGPGEPRPQGYDAVIAPDAPVVSVPIGAPAAVAWVQIHQRTDTKGRGQVLWEGNVGPTSVGVVLAGGERREVAIVDPVKQIWGSAEIEYQVVERLDGVAGAENVPDWRSRVGPFGFTLAQYVLRPGDPVFVQNDRTPQRLWLGGEAWLDKRFGPAPAN